MRLAPAEDKQIHRQHGEDKDNEGGPHPGLANVEMLHAVLPD
jgi:hypothetical protein